MDRLTLWLHLTSEHAGLYSPELSMEELEDIHQYEHKGPGTIRNHPKHSLYYSLNKVSEVLSEGDEEFDLSPCQG